MSTSLKEHPTVEAHRKKPALEKVSQPLDAAWLRQLCLDAGADDVGFVEVGRSALAEERPHIQRTFPHTRSVISFVLRMNRDNVRNPARSIANSEFHHTGDEVNDVARRITAALEHAENRSTGRTTTAEVNIQVGRALLITRKVAEQSNGNSAAEFTRLWV